MLKMLRRVLKRVPFLVFLVKSYERTMVSITRKKRMRALGKVSAPFLPSSDSKIVVSLTSFPARIDQLWIVIESLFQQDIELYRVVLTLAEPQFPDRKIPSSLERQVERGLELVWIDKDIRSYKKLIPVISMYPDHHIITVDDDVVYSRSQIRELIEVEAENPGSIVGHRGWEIGIKNNVFEKYINWGKASRKSESPGLMLTGIGGILYPPGSLDKDMVIDLDLAMNICPTADDIWFWAAAVKNNTRIICLGNHRQIEIDYKGKDTPLHKVNSVGGENDKQLERVVSHFGLRNHLQGL